MQVMPIGQKMDELRPKNVCHYIEYFAMRTISFVYYYETTYSPITFGFYGQKTKNEMTKSAVFQFATFFKLQSQKSFTPYIFQYIYLKI